MKNKSITKPLKYDPEIECTYGQNIKKIRERKSVIPIKIETKLKVEPQIVENKIVIGAGDGNNNNAIVANLIVG